MARAAKKVAPQPVLALPELSPKGDSFVILGLDPSLSRTGSAILLSSPTEQRWAHVGSVKPNISADPMWVRAKGMGLYLFQLLRSSVVVDFLSRNPNASLILSYEAPTPMNDYLNVVNAMLRSGLFEDWSTFPFEDIYELKTNASTMRSILGLTKTGTKNKSENQEKAWTFLPQNEFPGLDTDACDAVLFCVLAEWSARLFRNGLQDAQCPDNFKVRFCDQTPVAKGKGKNAYIVPRGVLLNPEYWFKTEPKTRTLSIKDARIPPRKRLEKVSFVI